MEPEMAVEPPMEPPMEPEMAVEPPMEAPLAASVRVDVKGVPKGAAVLIDGKRVRLPATFPGARGLHSLVITAAGYEPFVKNIEYIQDVELTFDAVRVSRGMDSGRKPDPDTAMLPDAMMEAPAPMNEGMGGVDFNKPDF
mgnify:CR=1 FL=1